MKTFITLITTIFAFNAFAGTGDVDSAKGIQSVRKSLYTDLTKDCVTVSTATQEAPIDFYEAECKAFGGYRLTITGGDLRYHPELYFGDKKIEIETPMSFHDTASTKIEWVFNHSIDKEGAGKLEWKGLIYRLNYTDSEDPNKNTDMLFVVRLDGAKSCLIGTTQSNVKAREMVSSSKPDCK